MSMKAIVVIMSKRTTGHGLSSSAAKVLSTVTPLATKLQIPIAVDLLKNGKI